MTKKLLVADVMALDPIVVDVDATLEDAAHLLHAYSISGLPVVERDGSLVGVISQTDLLAILDSPLGRILRTSRSGLRVGELMSWPAITVPLTGTLREAARLMIDSRVHRLVATDDEGRPVGVVSAIDFVGLYAED